MAVSIISFAIIGFGCAATEPSVRNIDVVANRAANAHCVSGVSEAAAEEARKAFPVLPTGVEERGGRNGFLYRNKRKFFDENHDGFIDFKEFTDEEWATLLAYLPEGQCTVTKEAYLAIFLGEKSDPENDALYKDGTKVKGFESQFDRLDKARRGYLVRDDFLPLWKAIFKAGDTNNDGKLDSKENP